ncbi:MAG: hypothetical protein ACI9R3_001442 [Verrucomicrobiales bacterium]|jgi:hypothetical protein
MIPINGETTLSWPGNTGFSYVVEYSDDLQTWPNDTNDPLIADQSGTMIYEVTSKADAPIRYYRVLRSSAAVVNLVN